MKIKWTWEGKLKKDKGNNSNEKTNKLVIKNELKCLVVKFYYIY